MDQVKKFLDALRADPRAKELIRDDDIGTREEALTCLADAAAELGFSLTGEEIVEGIEKLAEEQKAKTALAENEVVVLDMESLTQVSGGDKIMGSCRDTYNPVENCNMYDRCNKLLMAYPEENNCSLTWN